MTNYGFSPVPPSLAGLARDAVDRLRPISAELADIVTGCLTNAWSTTLHSQGEHLGFVPTGDIPAMWHRDTVGQLRPYLSLVADDQQIAAVMVAVVARMTSAIRRDPYANAFNAGDDGGGAEHDDHPRPAAWVWERKYELDSPAAFLTFAYQLWRAGGVTAHLDDAFDQAVAAVLTLWRLEQRHDTDSPYRFERRGGDFAHDTLDRSGLGAPTTWTGMTWSGFRPSDDRCTYGYLVPANVAAVVALRGVRDLARHGLVDAAHGPLAATLETEIAAGIERFGIVATPRGPMYAYEVDGAGAALLMDDANTPSLLALPYLGWCPPDDPVYARTREWVLSDANPYYFAGAQAAGVGSPHTPAGWVWPIAISMQALTSSSYEDKLALLLSLASTTAGTGLMHESFDVGDQRSYSRPWFAWANSLYAEALLDLAGMTVPRWLPPEHRTVSAAATSTAPDSS